MTHRDGVLLIGVGNPLRGDDGVGIEIVRKIGRAVAPRPRDRLRFREITGDTSVLIDAWRNEDVVFVFDAVACGAPPGTVHRLDASAREVTSIYFHGSTHSLGLGDAVELARKLGLLPKRLIIYGVEGKSFEIGAPLSREARRASTLVAARVLRELRALERPRGRPEMEAARS